MSSRATIRAADCARNTYLVSGYEPEHSAGEHDAALLREAQAGNAAAFEKMASEYDKTILAMLLALTASEKDALDLCHATLMAAYRKLSARRTCSTYIWLHRLAVEQWLQWANSRRACPEDTLAQGLSVCSRALRHLSPREQLVFTLKSCQRLSLRTVAQIVNESEETLARTFTRAVCKLRMAMPQSR